MTFSSFVNVDVTKILVSNSAEANNCINYKNVCWALAQQCFKGIVEVAHSFVRLVYEPTIKIPIKLLCRKLKELSPFFNYKGSMLTTGISFGQLLITLAQIIILTTEALVKWWKNKYDSSNRIRNKLLFWENIKKIWIENATGGAVSAITTIALGAILAQVVASAWVGFAAGIIGSLFGYWVKSLVSFKFFQEHIRDERVDEAIWKEFATKENKEIRKIYGNDHKWPTKAKDLAKYLYELKCSQGAIEGTLTTDRVKRSYKIHLQKLELEQSNNKKVSFELEKKELQLKKIICLRYVKFILEPATNELIYNQLDTKYEKKYLESLQIVVVNACKRYTEQEENINNNRNDGFMKSWMKWVSWS